jgi:hypothetical protein
MIAQSKNTANHITSKHYRIAQAFNREHVENQVGWFDFTESKLNEAEMFTKACSPRRCPGTPSSATAD